MAQTLSNIKIDPQTVTWNSVDMGYISGDIEISNEEQATDITTHQTGTEVLDSIRTGSSQSLSVSFLETSVAQLKALFAVAGGSNTPGGGTEVNGMGSSQRFTGQLADAQKLILHPKVLGSGDLSRDLCFWKAYPMLESITLSGESPMSVSVTFKIFEDSSKPAAINKYVQGDHTQTFV